MTAFADEYAVDQIDVFKTAVPLARPMVFSQGEDRVAIPVIVRATTANGIVGYGEAPGFVGPGVIASAIRALAPLALADSPAYGSSLLDRVAYRWNFFTTLRNSALSALDMALLDIRGRIDGVPVSELLGGRVHSKIDHFCWLHRSLTGGASEIADVVEQALEGVARGYRVFSVRVGFPERLDYVVDLVQEIRKAIGDDATLRLDANQAWVYEDAIRALVTLQDFNIDWIEDPIAPKMPSELLRLRDRTGIRICSDQMSYLPSAVRELVRSYAVQAICTDASRVGGLLPFVRLAAELHDEGVQVVRHCSAESSVFLAASLHAASAISNLASGNQHLTDLVVDDFASPASELRDGWMSVPTGAGLGIDVDEQKLLESTKFFETIDTSEFQRSRAMRWAPEPQDDPRKLVDRL